MLDHRAMAELACDSCGHGYYDTLPNCPRCAAPTVIRVHDPRPKYRRIGWGMIGVGVVLWLLAGLTDLAVFGYLAVLAIVGGGVMRVVADFSLRGLDD